MNAPKIIKAISGMFSGIMGSGTAQDDFLPMSGGNGIWTTALMTALTDKGGLLHALAPSQAGAPPFTPAPASGLFVQWGLRPHDLIVLRFAASHATDPNNKTATARVWLLGGAIGSNAAEECMGKYIGDLALTCGNQALTASSVFLNGTKVCKWCDTISKTVDVARSPGIDISGSSGHDAAAEAQFDSEGYRGVAVQVLPNDSTTDFWLPFYRKI